MTVSRRGTPLYGLNGDVRPDRVWFSEDFVLNGVSISSIFVLNRVSLHDLMYSLTTEDKKPNFYQFANVQHIEMRNSL